MFENHFFGLHPASRSEYAAAIAASAAALLDRAPARSYSGGSPAQLAGKLPEWKETGGTWAEATDDLRAVITNSVAVYHPHTCAHLHCPVLIAALSAEVVLTALNQSMDSFDQAPAATLIEQQVCDWVTRLVGYAPDSAAAFTTGGTQSNYLGLLLARDRWVRDHWGVSVQDDGLPPQALGRMKILCSEGAHFSVVKAAHQLGLGSAAVVSVAVDAQARMIPAALASTIAKLQASDREVFAVVATAGTTDAGAVDPLAALADLCRNHGIWLHVDGAWGSALLLSKRHRKQLVGIELADSVSLDFHKGFYQSVSCAAFAVRQAANFALIRHHADYLNPEEHEDLGVPDLVTHSLLTTRRFDSLKLWLTLRVVGVELLGAMVERTLELAAQVADHIRECADLELVCEPSFSSVLFRILPAAGESGPDLEALHAALPSELLHTGRGVIGFTKLRGRRVLKLTLLNPNVQAEDITFLLDQTVAAANGLRADGGHGEVAAVVAC